jgi:hypothetical protein
MTLLVPLLVGRDEVATGLGMFDEVLTVAAVLARG